MEREDNWNVFFSSWRDRYLSDKIPSFSLSWTPANAWFVSRNENDIHCEELFLDFTRFIPKI